MTFQSENDAFLSIQEHLRTCKIEVRECPTCRACYGERRPDALIRARFRGSRPPLAKEEGHERTRPVPIV